MRIPLLLLTVTVLVMLLADWRIFTIARKRISKNAGWLSLILALPVWIVLIVALCQPIRSGSNDTLVSTTWLLFTLASFLTPKLLFILLDGIALLPRLWKGKRWRIVTWIGGAISLAVFGCMWWGSLVNRFNTEVVEVEVEVDGLPEQFDGFKVAQLSDLHVGSYGGDTTFIHSLVEEVNALKPDAILFTGDIVNRRTEELTPFLAPLSRLKGTHGVYSVLGNHDYGDYYNWKSEADKLACRQLLVDYQRSMGWDILLDEHRYIRIGGDSIAIIGVENIGDPPFPVYGSLTRAMEGIAPDVTKILLSHNPVHWDEEVVKITDRKIALTLAGHTHAMQIELFGLSPAAVRYEKWGGLFSDGDGRYLYVNRGIGFVAIPMRIGATPEITLITLRKKR